MTYDLSDLALFGIEKEPRKLGIFWWLDIYRRTGKMSNPAAVQGNLTFTYAGNVEFARNVLDWTLNSCMQETDNSIINTEVLHETVHIIEIVSSLNGICNLRTPPVCGK